MKNKRRHDLETNELAKRLSDWGDRVRPYSKAITLTTAVAAVALVVWLVASRYAAAQRQRAWDVYMFAMTSASPDAYDALHDAAAEHAGTPMGELSSVTWADAQLRLATAEYFRDESESQKHLDNAVEAYRRLIDEADDETIKNRARLGMARALETDGKVTEAIDFYAAVRGPFQPFAAERAKQLGNAAVKDAIEWLVAAEVPEITSPFGPGTPGLRPPFGSDFSLDPEIPPQGSVPFSGGLDGPLLPGNSTSGAADRDLTQPPLEIENPFAGPSDPNRYAAPPQDAQDDQPATPPPSDHAPTAKPSVDEGAADESSTETAADDEGAAEEGK